MKTLVACEESQEVCKAFRMMGHEAYSCDVEPCSGGHPVQKKLDCGLKDFLSSSQLTLLNITVVVTNLEHGSRKGEEIDRRIGAKPFRV